MATTQRELDAARRLDGVLARGGVRRLPGAHGVLRRRLSMVAVMNAVTAEGSGVMTEAGEPYWQEQEQHYHGMDRGNLAGSRNRYGRVTFRKVYGQKAGG